MGNKDLVILSLIGAFMLLLIITISLSFYNNKRFIAVCDLYEKEVGPLPLKITICKEAGFFLRQRFTDLKSILFCAL